MCRHRLTTSLIFALLACVSGFVQSDDVSGIEQARNMVKTSEEASKSGVPVAILFVSKYCAYCERLKAEFLLPKLANGDLDKRIVIRELDIDNYRKMTDFDGERIRSRQLTRRYGVVGTPALVFLDYRGNELTQPIVGYSFDDYQSLVDRALEDSDVVLARHNILDRNKALSQR